MYLKKQNETSDKFCCLLEHHRISLIKLQQVKLQLAAVEIVRAKCITNHTQVYSISVPLSVCLLLNPSNTCSCCWISFLLPAPVGTYWHSYILSVTSQLAPAWMEKEHSMMPTYDRKTLVDVWLNVSVIRAKVLFMSKLNWDVPGVHQADEVGSLVNVVLDLKIVPVTTLTVILK